MEKKISPAIKRAITVLNKKSKEELIVSIINKNKQQSNSDKKIAALKSQLNTKELIIEDYDKLKKKEIENIREHYKAIIDTKDKDFNILVSDSNSLLSQLKIWKTISVFMILIAIVAITASVL